MHNYAEPKTIFLSQTNICWIFFIQIYCPGSHTEGQNELATTNAPIGRSVHWMDCVFSFNAKWGSSQSISFCCWPLYFILFFWFLVIFPLDLTYHPDHFPTFISSAPTLVPYLLSPTDIATLITSYHIDLAIILTIYPTNLATLLITYPTNLTIILTTHPTDLATLHTQPPY